MAIAAPVVAMPEAAAEAPMVATPRGEDERAMLEAEATAKLAGLKESPAAEPATGLREKLGELGARLNRFREARGGSDAPAPGLKDPKLEKGPSDPYDPVAIPLAGAEAQVEEGPQDRGCGRGSQCLHGHDPVPGPNLPFLPQERDRPWCIS